MKVKIKQTFEWLSQHGVNTVNQIILQSKWLLLPFYLGLIVALALYGFKFFASVFALFMQVGEATSSEFMYLVINLVDIVMVASLIKMIYNGSYQAFINNIPEDKSEKADSGILKIKMGMSLVGISSIHLLETFLKADSVSKKEFMVKVAIHLVFLISTIGLALVVFLHDLGHKFKGKKEHGVAPVPAPDFKHH